MINTKLAELLDTDVTQTVTVEYTEPSSTGFKRTMVNLSQAKAAKKNKTDDNLAAAASMSASKAEAEDGGADIRKDLLKQFMQLNSNMQKMLDSL